MFKNILIISICTVGAMEWLKNLLPSKVTENKAALASISGVISAVGAVLFVAFGEMLGLVDNLSNTNWVNYVIYIASTVGCVQVNYTVLLKLFKSIIEKIKTKYSTGGLDEDQLADEIVNAIMDKATEAITSTVSNNNK